MATAKSVEIQTSKGRKTEVSKADGFVTLYVNSANVEVSNWDVRLRLGQILGLDEQTVRIEESVHVMMSHSHTRAFYKALGEIVQKLDAFDPEGAVIVGASSDE